MVDLKSMSKKKKAEYIWDYYKLYIIGVIAIICVVGSLIHSQLTKVDYVFNLTVIGNVVDVNKKNDLENKITSIVVNDGAIRKQAIVDIIPPASSNNPADIMPVEYMQRFMAMLSVGELDIVIMDKNIFETLAQQDILLRLDNTPSLNLASIKNEKLEARAGDNKMAVYAINAEGIEILKDMGYDTENKVISIISSTKQQDNGVLVLKWLLNR
jgi:hypothetical protein